MATASDGSRPFRSETRRAVGRACSISARTFGDLSRQLGRPDGSLRDAVKNLVEEKVLREVSVPHSDGAAYELTGKGRRQLGKAVPSLAPPGLLMSGQDVFMLSTRDLQPLLEEFQAAVAWGGLVWFGRLYGGPFTGMAVFDAEATDAERDSFAAMLGRREIEYVQVRLDWIREPVSLRTYAIAALEGGPRGLNRGS